MFSWLSRVILKMWGWKVTGHYPSEIPKCVVAVAPHTSWWDFPLGLLVRSAYRLPANYVGKHTLFKKPFGFIFRWLGGIPVDRSKKNGNFVSATVEAFNREPHFHLVIAPEGTRKKVERFKTGFYHIARLAGAPIVLCQFNWKDRVVFFDPELFYPTDNETADLDFLWNYFKGIPGYHPELSVGG